MTLHRTDGESVKPFPQKFVDGLGSIDSLYQYPKFRTKLRGYCYSFSFKAFNGTCDPEDLYQDVCVKVWKRRSELLKPGNIMNEEEFFGWLFILTRNHYFSRLRQLKTLRKYGFVRDDTPVEEIDVAAPDDGSEGSYFLRRFLGFIEQYTDARQLALKLWLEGYSYREIEEKLRGTSSCYSHVTVRNWVTASLDAFRKSVGVASPEKTVSVSGTRHKRVGHLRSIVGR